MLLPVVSTLIVAVGLGQVLGQTCHHPGGGATAVGSEWVAQDGCNVCTCMTSGAHCDTWKNCNNHNHLGDHGDPVCTYAETQHYTVGQRWQTEDGCNHCVCTAHHGMNCTAHHCHNTVQFATPKPPGSTMEFEDCRYLDHIYHKGDHFQAADGCNTCVCSIPGNFAYFPACTHTHCPVVG